MLFVLNSGLCCLNFYQHNMNEAFLKYNHKCILFIYFFYFLDGLMNASRILTSSFLIVELDPMS